MVSNRALFGRSDGGVDARRGRAADFANRLREPAAVSACPMVAAFEQRCRRHPDDLAVEWSSGSVTVSEIWNLSGRLLRNAPSVERGSMLGLAAPNGAGFLAGLLACLRSGWVPILIDASTPGPAQRRALEVLGGQGALFVHVATPTSDADWTWSSRQATGCRIARPSVVKLSSGSTGEPRGIVTSCAALVADDRALASTMQLTATDRILAAVPLSFSYGLSSIALPVFMRRSTVVLPDHGPLGALRTLRERTVDVLPTVPAWLQGLIEKPQDADLFGTVRTVISAGAPLAAATARRFHRLYDCAIHAFYGASECGGITYDRTGEAALHGRLGTPVDGVELSFDGDGSQGIVIVRSEGVSDRYLPDSDDRLDGERFITADVGCLQAGELVLLGRVDDVINVRGKKVYPAEVEACLRAHAGVVEALAFAERGRAGDVVSAVVVVRDQTKVELLMTHCRSQLSDHKVPRGILIVPEIPRNERGKLDRQALSKLRAGEPVER